VPDKRRKRKEGKSREDRKVESGAPPLGLGRVKLVVWPKHKPDLEERGVYRYSLIGMLFTYKRLSIEEFSKNEIVVEGVTSLPLELEMMPRRASKITLSDATDVMLSLGDL
jgi:hypothetical protein